MTQQVSSFKDRLQSPVPLFGTLVTLPSPEVLEILDLAGFDWLWIDMEHGLIDFADLRRLLQSAGSRIPCMVRVPSSEESWIKRVLDAGCSGIIAPMIKDPAQVERVVAETRYPPLGSRSVGLSRAQGYGLEFDRYMQEAEQKTCLIIQIEHIAAVERIDDILDIPGIDAVMVGPYDLSGSMNRPGEVNHPEVRDQISKIAAACDRQRIPCGIFAATPDAARPYIDAGFTLTAVGTDSLFLGNAASEALRTLKPSI